MWNTMNMFLVSGMDVAREKYNVKHYGKHEIVFMDTCLLYLYLPPDWVGQHFGTYQNNATKISSTVSHDVQR